MHSEASDQTAQMADLNLHWVHMSEGTFSDPAAHLLAISHIALDKMLFQFRSIDIFLISA